MGLPSAGGIGGGLGGHIGVNEWEMACLQGKIMACSWGWLPEEGECSVARCGCGTRACSYCRCPWMSPNHWW